MDFAGSAGKPGLRGGPFRQKKTADTMVCCLRLSHRLGQDAADVARDVAVGDGLYSSTEMVARVRRFRRTMPIRRLWVVFTPSAVNSTGVLLRSSSLALSSFRISLTYWGGRQPLSSSWTVSGSSMGCWQQAASRRLL